ncbi:MAG: fasciclin domain-containing protein [Phycisphaerales bacterium]|nr:fasciclin domain-containing protein [Phycisphaerales bacterium]
MKTRSLSGFCACVGLLSVTHAVLAGQKDIVDTAVSAGSFKTLATALTKADLVGTLKGKGPFTVFAPTDDAFAKLPKKTLETLLKPENRRQLTSILTYHVVPGRVEASQVVKMTKAGTVNGQQIDIKTAGGKVMVDAANVIKTDIVCTNGIIHVIDSVIMPSMDDIVETAVKAGKFKTLTAALKAAGLVDALKGDGPFTVFAPTDEAFAKLPKGTLESLLKPENKEKLVSILKYHVVSGRVFAEDALRAGKARTIQKSEVWIRTSDGKPKVNDATIAKVDIDASNGVIHVIDGVLIPKTRTSQGPATTHLGSNCTSVKSTRASSCTGTRLH